MDFKQPGGALAGCTQALFCTIITCINRFHIWYCTVTDKQSMDYSVCDGMKLRS